jgi:hypothetical protein
MVYMISVSTSFDPKKKGMMCAQHVTAIPFVFARAYRGHAGDAKVSSSADIQTVAIGSTQ